ncbi:GSCOCG00012050001-RA-CDS, partial [Cotesia congregata]
MGSTKNQSSLNYARVAVNDNFPKKDQAIIIDVIEESQISEYARALARLIDPTLIRFMSRISNNRVCVYLANKQTADNLIDKFKEVKINGKTLPIRPLISRHKRIILSNVCPVIPHYILEEKLLELNVTPMSPITFLRLGIPD